MKIGVLGTGIVGRAHAEKLAALGNDVVIGTRDVIGTMARQNGNGRGLPPMDAWLKEHARIRIAPFAEAAAAGEIVIEAIEGAAVLGVLGNLGKETAGKVLVDIANPLDFSRRNAADAFCLQHRIPGRTDPTGAPARRRWSNRSTR